MTPPIDTIMRSVQDISPAVIPETIDGLDEYILNKIYPIGSIYITSTDIDPSVQLGGTWEKFAPGRTLIGANDKHPLGQSGGEETHKLTVGELPNHGHTLNSISIGTENLKGYAYGNTSSSDNWNLFREVQVGGIIGTYTSSRTRPSYTSDPGYGMTIDISHSHSINTSTNNTGSSTGHNNMQPYIAVNMWKRTA